MYKRELKSQLIEAVAGERKVIILYGPRQAGKTTLIKALEQEIKDKILYFTGDDLFAQELFSKNELESLKRTFSSGKIIIIDEAQRIENVGLTLKLMVDNLSVTVVASGSASFDLANKINEPLTGRTKTFYLYPLSYKEVESKYKSTLIPTALDEMLRYGMYPKIHTLPSDSEKQDYLLEYLNNYLYKDILMFDHVRKPKKVIDLLSLLALQIGKEVSIAELAKHLALSQITVANYLEILEKMFVIVNLRGFSRNLRKEIYKTSKYYFLDTGLRNVLIRNFNPLSLRSDAGELFENWFVVEKIKRSSCLREFSNFYFWRTYDQQEIDLIEENNGRLIGYECKFSPTKRKAVKDWLEAYPGSKIENINSENFSGFLA